MNVIFGTDHAGFELKELLKPYVKELGFSVYDKGAFSYIEDDDYPDLIAPVAREVARDPAGNRGIILGGSGQGEAIVANRFPFVRAVVINCYREESDLDEVALTREHNDANVLSLGARFLTEEQAKAIVTRWLDISFSKEERHIRRIEKIEEVTREIS